ncbi:putative S-phase kinase-associated protein 1 [Hypsibius exemplaris]|uniref:S-phase kinase-associated protein 1 n=1 Tax=Hypsibius exemplaris TaxID=2072580 RepID=A0A1W0WZ59_HYPEX|nr:putative S-phase kinase-associated protein 1 [Hypsibius exemplaris]
MAATSSSAPVASTSSGDAPTVQDPKKLIKLESGDKEVFQVDIEVAKMSKVVRQWIEDMMDEQEAKTRDWSLVDPIPCPNVSGPILRKIIFWMEYHKRTDDPEVEKPEDDLSHFTDEVSDWDQEFVKVDQGTLFELIVASNYLNIKKLRIVCCKTVAAQLKKLSVEEIRATYNIENDFTPEEEEAIRKENEWCEDQDSTK